jgi:membrane protein DedA with SNARE-associated domain
MLSWLLDHLSNLPALLVYVVVGALVFVEAALLIGFVFPAETAVVVGGVLASHGGGTVNIAVLMIVVVVCAIVGDSVGYAIGHHFGERILNIRILHSRRGLIEWALDLVRRRGAAIVFLGRFTAFLRAMVPGLSGIARMHYRTFLAANAIGGIVWGSLFCYLGYLAGNAYQTVEKYASWAQYAVLGLIVVVVVTLHTLTKRKEQSLEQQYEREQALADANRVKLEVEDELP